MPAEESNTALRQRPVAQERNPTKEAEQEPKNDNKTQKQQQQQPSYVQQNLARLRAIPIQQRFKYLWTTIYSFAALAFLHEQVSYDGLHNVMIQWFFHRGLAITFFITFLSNYAQIIGLVGSRGILPLADTMKRLGGSKKASIIRYPTLFWLSSSDRAIHATCITGMAASALYLVDVAPSLALIVAFACHCSIKVIGREFYALQFDNLLLDTAFFAFLLIPAHLLPGMAYQMSPFWNQSAVFMLRWLVFRLMFSSGMCKIMSGDPTWAEGTALTYHYWTQPMPSWVSAYAHRLPLMVHKISCWGHFVVELGCPFAVFLPYGRLAQLCFLGLAGLQVGILATGNYGFFNLLSMLVPVLLLDDSVVPQPIAQWLHPYVMQSHTYSSHAWLFILPALALVALTLALTLVPFAQVSKGAIVPPEKIIEISGYLSPFGVLNYYGLFARMTTERGEIVIEGSNDGLEWREYEFRYKPGDVNHAPRYVIGHLPRLDWRMWFCQFERFRSYRTWFDSLLECLLRGQQPVLDLFAKNPFTEAPPKYLRALRYEYAFAEEKKQKEGTFWERSDKQLFRPIVSLSDDGEMAYMTQ